MKTTCLFCKILKKEIPSEIVYEDKDFFAIKDINPVSPLHLLLIPKKHIETLNDISPEDASSLGKIFVTIKELAKKNRIEDSGYRVVINCNRDAGQAVFHLHIHLLGGRVFLWPPG